MLDFCGKRRRIVTAIQLKFSIAAPPLRVQSLHITTYPYRTTEGAVIVAALRNLGIWQVEVSG